MKKTETGVSEENPGVTSRDMCIQVYACAPRKDLNHDLSNVNVMQTTNKHFTTAA